MAPQTKLSAYSQTASDNTSLRLPAGPEIMAAFVRGAAAFSFAKSRSKSSKYLPRLQHDPNRPEDVLKVDAMRMGPKAL
jgi:hypothetical protein